MAAGAQPTGSQSPTSVSRTIEKVFDESQYTGEINLSGRKLKDYPKCACKYDLVDTTSADLSKNRLNEIPYEICCCHSVERLNCYHNVIKCIPAVIVQLQNLVYLNLSRNLLSVIPPCLCQLKQLEVLLANNNRLVSLPEEIGKLQRLQQLDVSCNEITHLPDKIGDLERLRSLDVRKNLLVELPISICRLRLRRLDFSCNRIAYIPCDIRKVDTLEHLVLNNNPLLSPPANICTRGLVHIMKFLNAQAARSETKKDVMYRSDLNIRGTIKRSQSCLPPGAGEDIMESCTRPSRDPTTSSRHSLVSSGYSTMTEPGDRSAWSRSEYDNDNGDNSMMMMIDGSSLRPMYVTEDSVVVWNSVNPDDISRAMAIRTAESAKGLRSEREHPYAELPINGLSPKTPENGLPKMTLRSPRSPEFLTSADADEFTRELQRQKADYDARRKRAEQLRLSVEEAEKEERRHAAQKQQEEQLTSSPQQNTNDDRLQQQNQDLPHSRSFSEVKNTTWHLYNRTNSDSGSSSTYSYTNGIGSPISSSYGVSATTDRLLSAVDSGGNDSLIHGNGVSSRQSQTLPRRCMTPSWDTNGKMTSSMDGNHLPLENEFRRRHEAMVAQQRQEAYNVLRRLQEMQRPRVTNAADTAKQAAGRIDEESVSMASNDERYRDGTTSSFMLSDSVKSGVPTVDPSNSEVIGDVPSFTIRRNMKQVEADREHNAQIRKIVETILNIKLPEDLLGALHDGVILCHLANHMRPHSVTSIHVPSPAVPKLTLAKCRRNVENFLLACRRVGVNQSDICSASSILEDRERGLSDVATTIRALVECTAQHTAQQPKQSAV